MSTLLSFPSLIRIGLACVFLANSLTAFLEPDEFIELVSNSFVSGLLPVSVSTFVTFIGFNDLTVAVLLFLGWRTSYVATYATAWITGVTVVVGIFTADALEHLGFITMSVALAMRGRSR